MNIYLDHAATTPLDPEVLETMLPWMGSEAYNANSTHQFGRRANVMVEEAREFIAQEVGAKPSEIIFTSGGTESNNAAIHGANCENQRKHYLSSVIEHHAVLEPIEHLSTKGAHSHTFLTPNSLGIIETDQLKEALSDKTLLVSLMHVNNEIGAVNPIKELCDVCKERNILFHSDCVQSIGKVPVNFQEMGVDFASMSAHKIYGPKGVGFLYVRSGVNWNPWLLGGSQERNRRGGTLNVAGIIGMAKALHICSQRMQKDMQHYASLRARLLEKITPELGEYMIVNGGVNDGLPHILNLSFDSDNKGNLDGEMLLFNLDIEGIAVSNGSACTSGAVLGSHVLRGIGRSNEVAKSSIRLSFGRSTTLEQIDYTSGKIIDTVKRMLTSN